MNKELTRRLRNQLRSSRDRHLRLVRFHHLLQDLLDREESPSKLHPPAALPLPAKRVVSSSVRSPTPRSVRPSTSRVGIVVKPDPGSVSSAIELSDLEMGGDLPEGEEPRSGGLKVEVLGVEL